MRRIEGRGAAIMIAIAVRLTFRSQNIAKRYAKSAIFRISTICLAYLSIITIPSSLFSSDTLLLTIHGQRFDNVVPVITVPDDFVVNATIIGQGVEVLYTVTGRDNVDGIARLEEDGSTVTQDDIGGNITISCSPPSGFEFPIRTTTVECIATDEAGNTGGPESFTVMVNRAPPASRPTAEISSSGTQDEVPATFEFEANVKDGTEPYTYSWDFDGDGTEDSNEPIVSYTFDEPGTYDIDLTITDSNGINASDSIVISVIGDQEFTVDIINPSGTEGFAPATFEFQAEVLGGTEPYTYSWDFDGDGTEDSNESSYSYTFDEPGTYSVTLAATDAGNQNESDNIVIRVNESPPPPPPPPPPIEWVIPLVTIASIVIGGIALGKYNVSRSNRRIKIPSSALVEIKAKGGID